MLEIAEWRENVSSKIESNHRYELEHFSLKSCVIDFLENKQRYLNIFFPEVCRQFQTRRSGSKSLALLSSTAERPY